MLKRQIGIIQQISNEDYKKKAKAEERKAAAASKKPKKRVRKVKSNRGYFDNSSEGEGLKEYIFSYSRMIL